MRSLRASILRIIEKTRFLRRRKTLSLREINLKKTTLKASIRNLFLRFNTLIINSIDIIKARSNA